MNDRETTQTLTDRRQEDRRGKGGKAMSLHEFLWRSQHGLDRRQEDRRGR